MRFLACATLLASHAAQADPITWTGATNTWNTAGNWSGTNTPPLSGDSLVFNAPGAGGLTLNNDLTNAAFNVAGITFNAAAGSYVLGDGTATANAGNAFTLGGNISINTSAAQIINNPITLSGSPVFFVNTGRSITLAGDIDGNTGLNKLQGGLLVLSGTNTYTGVTKLGNFGNLINVLRADDGVGLPAASNLQIDVGVFETGGDLVRPGGSSAGQMRFGNQKNDSGFSAHGGPVNVAFGSLATPESLTWQSGSFNWGNYALILNYTDADNTLDFKNDVSFGSTNREVRVDATNVAAVATMSGVLSASTAGVGFEKQGVGHLVLAGLNTYTGDTVVSGGTLTVADDAQLKFEIGASGVNNAITGGGTINLNGDFLFDLTGAGSTVGDMWSIVDVDNLDETFGSSFSVLGFADNLNDTWSNGNYLFSEASGTLSFIPEPAAALLSLLGLGTFVLRRRRN